MFGETLLADPGIRRTTRGRVDIQYVEAMKMSTIKIPVKREETYRKTLSPAPLIYDT